MAHTQRAGPSLVGDQRILALEASSQILTMTLPHRLACSVEAGLKAQVLTLFSSGMTAFTSLIFFSDTGGRSTS